MSLVFAAYVSSVEGRLVSRWDVGPWSYFGARVASAEERAKGAEPIVWEPERVIPLTAEFCQRFERELRDALANGDLRKRTAKEHEAWLKAELEADEKLHGKAEEPKKKDGK